MSVAERSRRHKPAKNRIKDFRASTTLSAVFLLRLALLRLALLRLQAEKSNSLKSRLDKSSPWKTVTPWSRLPFNVIVAFVSLISSLIFFVGFSFFCLLNQVFWYLELQPFPVTNHERCWLCYVAYYTFILKVYLLDPVIFRHTRPSHFTANLHEKIETGVSLFL